MKKILAFLMALIILVVALPITVGAATADITTGEVAGKTYVLGDVLYETDFEEFEDGTMPTGWEVANTSFGYPSKPTDTLYGNAEIFTTTTSIKKVLKVTSTGIDTWVSMPEVKTRNYVYEFKIMTDGTCSSGSFGFANGMYGGIKSAEGATYTTIPISSNATVEGTYRTKGYPTVSSTTFNVAGKTSKGGSATIKVVCLDGVNYFYYRDTYVGAFAQGASDSTSDWPGIYTYQTYNGSLWLYSVKVTEIITPEQELSNVTVSADSGASLDVTYSFDKANKVYQSNSSAMKFGMVYATSDSNKVNNITKDTEGAVDVISSVTSQNTSRLYFKNKISVGANLDKFYEVRPYVLIGDTYIYGESASYCPAKIANNLYGVSNAATQQKLAAAFAGSAIFKTEGVKTLTFTMFSDFHYEEGKYIGTIAELREILNRADESGSAFVMSGGDFCNNMEGSKELTNAYLNFVKADGTVLDAYNIYGNHELEANNRMEYVTGVLTNQKDNVVWGTADGSYDYNIGYYYFEENGFRIVCLDTNYSYNKNTEQYEHNYANSYGPPSGNTNSNSLGPVQLAWLENVLTDAANNNIPCIVVGHAGYSGAFATSAADAAQVRAIYAKVNAIKAGTVIMSINGHEHTNHQGYVDGVFYFDTNTVKNGYWKELGGSSYHYKGVTYDKEVYDDDGNLIEIVKTDVSSLYQGRNTYFFEDPLSAVITVDEFGTVTVDGMETDWLAGIAPTDVLPSGKMPSISSGTYWDDASLGHVFGTTLEYNDTHHWNACENGSCISKDPSLHEGYVAHTFEEIEDEKFAVPGVENAYFKSCVCGFVSDEEFGEGADAPKPPVIWDGNFNDDSGNLTAYAGGSGTAADPWLIETPDQLARMIGYDVLTKYTGDSKNDSSGKYYKLMSDIYLNDVSAEDWYLGDNLNAWYSTNKSRFNGCFDGNGYTVYGLWFDENATHSALIPVFDAYSQPEVYIKNVTVSHSYITSTNDAGVFTSLAYNSGKNNQGMVFENCHATDTVTISGSYTGIIIGFAATSVYARVYNCTSFAKSPSGSCVTYSVNGLTGNYTHKFDVSNSVFYASKLSGSSKNTGVVSNTVHVTDMAKLSGETAKETLAGVSGYCFAEDGTPMNKAIAQMRGDANCDGTTNKQDLHSLRAAIIGKDTVSLDDINNDGTSDICDLVLIRNKINER